MNPIIDKILEYVDKERSRGTKIVRRSYGSLDGCEKCFMHCVTCYSNNKNIPPWQHEINRILGTQFSGRWYLGFFAECNPQDMDNLESYHSKQRSDEIRNMLQTEDAINGGAFAKELIAEYLSRGGIFEDA